MKVYVVEWFTAEPYENWSGIQKVFDSREKAEDYLEDVGRGPHDVDDENFNPGYYLSDRIEEYEVE